MNPETLNSFRTLLTDRTDAELEAMLDSCTYKQRELDALMAALAAELQRRAPSDDR